jgi:alanine racemase
MDTDHFSTWLEINLGAIQANIRRLTELSGKPVMAVVKANAYGHGLVQIAQAAEQAGAGWLGVARFEEAVDLRQAGLRLPILVMGFTAPQRAAEAVGLGISLAVYNLELGQALGEAARAAGTTRLEVHAKIDSGMGRLGVFPEDGETFVRQLRQVAGLNLTGLFTHFPCADEIQRQTTLDQIERFKSLVGALERVGMRPPLVHAANSATTLEYPQGHFDMVRCGISMYGLHPSAETPNPPGFEPALTWKARLASVKYLPEAHGVGYNYRYRTNGRERIGAAACGYADGFRRRLGNVVLVHGKRVNVVGGVCMDQFMLQLDSVPEAKIGDEIVLLGRQGDEIITAEELGQAWGTNNYEVVCGLANRVPRIYYE